MFPNLSAELARNRMDLKALSAESEIGYESLKNKVRGVTEFKRDEMIRIKKVFPECTMDYLFASDEDEK
jgi:hypothetical protein